MEFKIIYLATRNGRENLKFAFINAIAFSLLLLQVSIACNPANYFNMRKKMISTYIVFLDSTKVKIVWTKIIIFFK